MNMDVSCSSYIYMRVQATITSILYSLFALYKSAMPTDRLIIDTLGRLIIVCTICCQIGLIGFSYKSNQYNAINSKPILLQLDSTSNFHSNATTTQTTQFTISHLFINSLSLIPVNPHFQPSLRH